MGRDVDKLVVYWRGVDRWPSVRYALFKSGLVQA